MLNYWWVTRPKRKLDSVPEVLATVASETLGNAWQGQKATQLNVEEALERAGLKRAGERRDQSGGGARTYLAWLSSLGLLFRSGSEKTVRLTLAGEDILKGVSPVRVLTTQILRYQFPSPFSLSRSVSVSGRFRIRPFRFLFRLLADPRIEELSQRELGLAVATEAETETNECFERIVARVLDFRNRGDSALDSDFQERYATSKESAGANPVANLLDIANTIMNWAEYPQLARRNERRNLAIAPGRLSDVTNLLAIDPPFIERPGEEEFFQRKFGLGADHSKDTRNLSGGKTITPAMVAASKIKTAFIAESCRMPISSITTQLVQKIAEQTGIVESVVEDVLQHDFPRGSIPGFLHSYYEMAFAGRDEATDFEVATTNLFRDVFGFSTKHIGPMGLTPDVLLLSHEGSYQAILDNKAYREYNISNDHYNRMVTNYINGLSRYSNPNIPLAFFSYIAGGFNSHIEDRLSQIATETKVNGSAMPIATFIRMIESHLESPYTQEQVRNIFSVDRIVRLEDL